MHTPYKKRNGIYRAMTWRKNPCDGQSHRWWEGKSTQPSEQERRENPTQPGEREREERESPTYIYITERKGKSQHTYIYIYIWLERKESMIHG